MSNKSSFADIFEHFWVVPAHALQIWRLSNTFSTFWALLAILLDLSPWAKLEAMTTFLMFRLDSEDTLDNHCYFKKRLPKSHLKWPKSSQRCSKAPAEALLLASNLASFTTNVTFLLAPEDAFLIGWKFDHFLGNLIWLRQKVPEVRKKSWHVLSHPNWISQKVV